MPPYLGANAARVASLRCQFPNVRNVGIDEKSFGKGQDYVSIMTDLGTTRVLDVVPERTREAADKLWQNMDNLQRKLLQAVAMDMWSPFMEAIRAAYPDAAIVHDRFHVSKYLGEALDKVRRQEHIQLSKEGDDSLKGTRQLWLYAMENLPKDRSNEFFRCNKLQGTLLKSKTLTRRLSNNLARLCRKRHKPKCDSFLVTFGLSDADATRCISCFG